MNCSCRIVILTLLLAAHAVISSAAEGDGQLRWKFKAGKTFSYAIEQNMTLRLTVGPTTTETTVHQTIDLEWAVDEVNPNTGDAEMTHTIKRIKIEIESPATGKIEFDSDAKGDAEGLAKLVSPVLSTLVGSKVRLRMSPRGDINEVRVPDDVLGAFKDVKGASLFGEMFSQEGFRKLIKQASMVLPEKVVDTGWKRTQPHTVKNLLLGKMTADTTYTYAGTETIDGRELAKFDVAVEIAFDEETKSIAEVVVKKQNSSGSIYFDPVAGRMDHTHVKQELELEVTIAGQKVTQKITSDTRLKVKGGK